MKALLLEQEAQRFKAIVDGEVAILERCMHPELVYVHTSGNVESKAKFIDALACGTRKYSQFDRLESHARIAGDHATLHGMAKCVLVSKGVSKDFTIRYLSCLICDNGEWRLVNWHSTIVPSL